MQNPSRFLVPYVVFLDLPRSFEHNATSHLFTYGIYVYLFTYGKLIPLSLKTTTLYQYCLTLRTISCNLKLPTQPQNCEYNIKPCWLICGF